MGNCYKIEYPNNKSNIYKIVNNPYEEYYTLVNNSCLNEANKYIIVSIGECVSKYPNETIFHSDGYNKKVNFSSKGVSVLEKKYPLTLEKTPKFLFNNLCY